MISRTGFGLAVLALTLAVSPASAKSKSMGCSEASIAKADDFSYEDA